MFSIAFQVGLEPSQESKEIQSVHFDKYEGFIRRLLSQPAAIADREGLKAFSQRTIRQLQQNPMVTIRVLITENRTPDATRDVTWPTFLRTLRNTHMFVRAKVVFVVQSSSAEACLLQLKTTNALPDWMTDDMWGIEMCESI